MSHSRSRIANDRLFMEAHYGEDGSKHVSSLAPMMTLSEQPCHKILQYIYNV